MNKKEWLVFYTTYGDGCTFSFDKFIPFQYSSKKDAEDLLLEYAYELLELFVKGMNTEDLSEYFKHLKETAFFSVFEFEFNDIWYYNRQISKKNLNKSYKTSDYQLRSFQIYTLQEWAEVNEEKVKYLQKPFDISSIECSI